MTIEEFAKSEDVIDLLEIIRDKIDERGLLLGSTKDEDCGVSIKFATRKNDDGKPVPCMIINCMSETCECIDRDTFLFISGYVIDKVSNYTFLYFPKKLQTFSKKIRHTIIQFNGKDVCRMRWTAFSNKIEDQYKKKTYGHKLGNQVEGNQV